MLALFSWPQYFVAVIALTGIYYLYVFLRYYPGEFKRFVSPKKLTAYQGPLSPLGGLMADARPDPGITIISSDQLHFAAADEQTETVNEKVRALEQETAELAAAFREIDDKPQFLSLLQILLDKYRPLAPEIQLRPSLEKVWTQFRDLLPFQLTAADMPADWN